MNNKELKKYGEDLFRKWWKKLSKCEKRTIRLYKLSKHVASKVNHNLRNDIYDQRGKIIEKALAKSIIDKDLILLRNTNNDFLKANGKTIETLQINDLLIEKGFMSTSLYKSKFSFKGKILLRIKCPTGTQGAYIDKCCVISWGEKEILINRNMKIRIENIERKSSQTIIDASII